MCSLWIFIGLIAIHGTNLKGADTSNENLPTIQPNQKTNSKEIESSLTIEIDEKDNFLKPEYHHPKGTETFDPYKSGNVLGKHGESEDEEEDYYYDLKKSHEEGDHHDLLPSLDVEHLLHNGNDNKVMFLLEPQDAFVTKGRPATLSCQAANALQVYFKCNGVRPDSSQYAFVDPQSGVRIIEAECNVTHERVEEYFGNDRFKCVCYGWTSREEIQSQPAFIETAYIKKQFIVSPHSTMVPLHGQVSLKCRPPPAAPPPKVSWLKDNNPLVADENILISDDGIIHFSQAALKDMANYTCVAENIAGKRTSEPALLTVYVDGGWSSWSAWVDCRCGTGKRRTRTCTNPAPSNGGAPCLGNPVFKSPDCLPCQSAVPGRWSQWSAWSICNRDCRQRRTRTCIGETSCSGRDVQYLECTSGLCGLIVGDYNDNLPLYVGILVAVIVFSGIAFTVFLFLRNRKRELYSRTRDGEKASCLQPDLMQHNKPPCYDQLNYQRNTNGSEHFYDVPQLSNSYSTPADQQITPCTSAESDEYEMKAYNSGRSFSSGNNSNSAYSGQTEKYTLPTQLADLVGDSQWSISRTIIGSGSGTTLTLSDAQISLHVPEGSCLRRSRLHLAVLKEERHRPQLPESVTQLSPVVKCGPSELALSKPVIVEMPHCADLTCDSWTISVYGYEQQPGHDTRHTWRKIVSLGQETINTPVYTQLDYNRVFLVTDYLSTFVLVGEDKNGKSTKNLKLMTYGPPISSAENGNYSVRVYAVDDTPSAKLQCEEREKRLGGSLLDDPRAIKARSGSKPLCIFLENYRSDKCDNNYQELSSEQIWGSTYNVVYFSLELDKIEKNKLEFTISILQEIGEINSQTFYVKFCNGRCETAPAAIKKSNIIENPFECRTLPIYGPSDTSFDHRSFLSQQREKHESDEVWKISPSIRSTLCAELDPPKEGADWRTLARELGVARYLQYWAARVSPSDHVLALWEVRTRNDRRAPQKLIQILEKMGRSDLAILLKLGLSES